MMQDICVHAHKIEVLGHAPPCGTSDPCKRITGHWGPHTGQATRCDCDYFIYPDCQHDRFLDNNSKTGGLCKYCGYAISHGDSYMHDDRAAICAYYEWRNTLPVSDARKGKFWFQLDAAQQSYWRNTANIGKDMKYIIPPAPPEAKAAPRPLEKRIGDAERTQAVDDLSTHFSQGRLTQAQFDSRMARAFKATYQSQLDKLFTDLPLISELKPPGGSLKQQDQAQADNRKHFLNTIQVGLLGASFASAIWAYVLILLSNNTVDPVIIITFIVMLVSSFVNYITLLHRNQNRRSIR